MREKNPKILSLMFDKISNKYDFMNFIISFGLHGRIKKSFIKSLKISKPSTMVDLCTGTGDLAFEIIKNKNVEKVTGVDFSDSMLKIAKSKNKSARIEFIKSDCENLPFEDSSVDFAVMGFGLRNMKNYKSAISEIRRILKTGGFFAHIDIFKGFLLINFLFDFYVKTMAKILKADGKSYNYLLQSKNEFLSAKELSKEIENLGFKEISAKSYALCMIRANVFYKCQIIFPITALILLKYSLLNVAFV